MAAGSDKYACDLNGESALDWATKRGHPAVAHRLSTDNRPYIEPLGLEPSHCSSLGKKVWIAVFDSLITSGADLNSSDSAGRTHLHYSAFCNHLAGVEKLIAAGADLNAIDFEGRTPLHYAVARRHPAIIKKLIIAGAGIDTPDSNEQTPLHYAAKQGQVDLIATLIAANREHR